MIRRCVVATSIALSVAAMPTSGSAADNGVPQQLQQIQEQLQAIQAALTGQGDSLTQQLQALQTALVGQAQQLQTLQTTLGGVAKARKFYLTRENTFDGSEAPSACAAGYHMASLWEIFDPSNLVYDTALGHPSGDAYTINDADTKGTVAALQTNWTSGAGVIDPWVASTRACDQPVFVWCVQN